MPTQNPVTKITIDYYPSSEDGNAELIWTLEDIISQLNYKGSDEAIEVRKPDGNHSGSFKRYY